MTILNPRHARFSQFFGSMLAPLDAQGVPRHQVSIMIRRGFPWGFEPGRRARFEFETALRRRARPDGYFKAHSNALQPKKPPVVPGAERLRDFSKPFIRKVRAGAFEDRRNRRRMPSVASTCARSASGAYSAGSRTGKPMVTRDRPIFFFFTSLDIRSTVGCSVGVTRPNAISDVPLPLSLLCRVVACDGDERRRAGAAGPIFLWRRTKLYFGA